MRTAVGAPAWAVARALVGAVARLAVARAMVLAAVSPKSGALGES
jgi:hypothetical protein